MSETVNQNEAIEEPKAEPTNEEKLFTQEEVNGFFKKRYSDLMSKVTEYEEKAKKYDEMEEANKTELQKATERAEKLQAELSAMKHSEEIRVIREKVAKETGVPSSLLTGDTEEACTEQANGILSFKSPSGYPTIKDGGEITINNSGDARSAFKEWAAAINN